MEQYRTCTKCNLILPANKEYFHAEKTGLYGLKPICKMCTREYNEKYRQANRASEHYSRWQLEKIRLWIEYAQYRWPIEPIGGNADAN